MALRFGADLALSPTEDLDLAGKVKLDLKGSFAYDEEEIRTVLRFMEKGLITTEGMLNKTFKLEEAQIALEELSKTTEPVRYALVS